MSFRWHGPEFLNLRIFFERVWERAIGVTVFVSRSETKRVKSALHA